MHRITIQYDVPADPVAFDSYYFEKHLPLVEPLPGLRSFSWSKPQPLGGETKVYLVAQLDFDDADAIKRVLSSAEMAAAGKDAAGLGVPMTMFSGEVVEANA
jgi:uncharacterized protein (TIGR02118 family)